MRDASAAEPQWLQNFTRSTSSRLDALDAPADEMLAIIVELIDRLVDVGERLVLALLDPGFRHVGLPSLAQLLQRRYVEVPVMKVVFERRHPPGEEAAILADRVAAHRRGAWRHVLAQEREHPLFDRRLVERRCLDLV